MLGVEPSWTLDEIEARYRELVLQHHPDLHRNEGAEAVAAAEHRTRLLNDSMAKLRKRHPVGGYASSMGAATSAGSASGNGHGDREARQGGTRTAGFSEPDTSTWTTGPNGEDFGIKYQWPPPPPEGGKPRREQPCPFCGELFSELPSFETHLGQRHGWDYRNARPRQSRRRKRHRLQRGPRFSKAERYIETAATAACVIVIGMCIWYRSTTSGFVARAVLDPFLFLMVAFCSVIAFRLIFWRSK